MVIALLVGDDPAFLEQLAVALHLMWPDSEFVTATNGQTARAHIAEEEFDFVVLDVGLEKRNGYVVLNAIRRVSDAPVIVLTALNEDDVEVRSLELGADDFVGKPVSFLVLAARVNALLRRSVRLASRPARADFEAGDLTVNFGARLVTKDGMILKLRPAEYKLLYQLVRNADRLMSHQALLGRVWGPDSSASQDNLKMLISRLRAKIEPEFGPRYIETERGLGYRFVRPGFSPAPPSRVLLGHLQ